jgi:hypothetical protein
MKCRSEIVSRQWNRDDEIPAPQGFTAGFSGPSRGRSVLWGIGSAATFSTQRPGDPFGGAKKGAVPVPTGL